MLKLEYKKISSDAKKAMQNAITTPSNNYYNNCIKSIQNIIPSKETYILNSANSCIFTICEAIQDTILIQDMGGWNGFERSAKILNKKIEKIETNNGLINPKNLEYHLIKNNHIQALYMTSLAGYTALQPIEEIQNICKKYDVILILDISGTIGSEIIKNYDIIISSTGSPKILNIENGGFININTDKIKLNNHLLKTFKADHITCAGITKEIQNTTTTLKKTIKFTKYLKEKINNSLDENHKLIHPKSDGINIIITAPSKSKAKKISFKIREQIEITNNKSIITIGPNYNRLKKPCICIEIKNLDINSVNTNKLDQLNEIILNSFKE